MFPKFKLNIVTNMDPAEMTNAHKDPSTSAQSNADNQNTGKEVEENFPQENFLKTHQNRIEFHDF